MTNFTYCEQCEHSDDWIEVELVDEHGKPFNSLQLILTLANGEQIQRRAGGGKLLLTNIPAGPVNLQIAKELLLKEVETRRSRPLNEAPALHERAAAATGYKDTPRQYQLVTVGDLATPELVVDDLDQKRLQNHGRGKAGKQLKLVTRNSYLLEVKAFKLLTVRLGVFFDGTGNNTANALAGKLEVDEWLKECRDDVDKSWFERNIRDACAESPAEGSEANEITNVQKIRNLYKEIDLIAEKHLSIAPVYVEGIGTETGESDDIEGSAFGLGERGVVAKVEKGCSLLSELIYEIISAAGYEAVGALQFDVFGFSRGAAAARHFANEVISGGQEYLKSALFNQSVPLKNSFDWLSRNDSKICFLGVFDTVAAIATLNDGLDPHDQYNKGVNLLIKPDSVDHAVHIYAQDEFRHNFSSNRLSLSSGLPGNFTEVGLPGAHSDIGGGYRARSYFAEPAFAGSLLQEAACTGIFSSIEFGSGSELGTKAYRDALQEKQRLVQEGWATANQITIETRRYFQSGNYSRGPEHTVCKVIMIRIIEGELSRLSLNIMHAQASQKDVPLELMLNDHQDYFIPRELKAVQRLYLKRVAAGYSVTAHDSAGYCEGFKRKYIHHSAQAGSIAHKPAKNRMRGVYFADEGV